MASMAQFFLGVDDTDVLGHKPGTGRLARDLGAHLEQRGLLRLVGVVRQQLLVDPRIPYTSHNSPACLVFEVAAPVNGAPRQIFEEAAAYVQARSAQGSDPGLCLAARSQVGDALVAFGHRASTEVLAKTDAIALADAQRVTLRELGGTGDGIIGALAAVGLTAEGTAGRFLELAGGLRELGTHVPAAQLRQLGIKLLNLSRNGEVVPSGAVIDTGDRVRPRLVAGEPVLLVEYADHGWRCVDRKNEHSDHHDPEGAGES